MNSKSLTIVNTNPTTSYVIDMIAAIDFSTKTLDKNIIIMHSAIQHCFRDGKMSSE